MTAITTSDAIVAALRAAIGGALAAPDADDIAGPLLLSGVETLPVAAYDMTTEIADAAASLGYPEFA